MKAKSLPDAELELAAADVPLSVELGPELEHVVGVEVDLLAALFLELLALRIAPGHLYSFGSCHLASRLACHYIVALLKPDVVLLVVVASFAVGPFDVVIEGSHLVKRRQYMM